MVMRWGNQNVTQNKIIYLRNPEAEPLQGLEEMNRVNDRQIWQSNCVEDAVISEVHKHSLLWLEIAEIIMSVGTFYIDILKTELCFWDYLEKQLASAVNPEAWATEE